jgi:hypothetical protein
MPNSIPKTKITFFVIFVLFCSSITPQISIDPKRQWLLSIDTGWSCFERLLCLEAGCLQSLDKDNNKVLKFYACKADAEKALTAEKEVSQLPVTAVLGHCTVGRGLHGGWIVCCF